MRGDSGYLPIGYFLIRPKSKHQVEPCNGEELHVMVRDKAVHKTSSCYWWRRISRKKKSTNDTRACNCPGQEE